MPHSKKRSKSSKKRSKSSRKAHKRSKSSNSSRGSKSCKLKRSKTHASRKTRSFKSLSHSDIDALTERLHDILANRHWTLSEAEEFIDKALVRWERKPPQLYESEKKYLLS